MICATKLIQLFYYNKAICHKYELKSICYKFSTSNWMHENLTIQFRKLHANHYMNTFLPADVEANVLLNKIIILRMHNH